MFFSKASEKVCELSKRRFILSSEEVALYKSLNLPLPTLHPEERHRKQLAFRNARCFYDRKCDVSGEDILSIFDSSTKFPVVSNDYWWSSDFDPFAYAQDFSQQRPFFEQLASIWFKVPRPATVDLSSSNSKAVQHVKDVEDSYYLFDAQNVKNALYSVNIHDSEFCVDCYNVSNLSNCYECLDCHNCKNLFWSEHCGGCSDSWFLANCRNCSNCLFCTNLESQSYHIFNKSYSREDYFKELEKYDFTIRQNVEVAKNIFSSFLQEHPIPHIYSDTPQSVSGNYLKNCNQTHLSFECYKSTNVYSSNSIVEGDRCVDGYGFGKKVLSSGQFVSAGLNAKYIINSLECWNNVNNIYYSTYCTNSSYLFACVGMKNAEYCILNKQYSKKNYLKKVKEIIAYLNKKNVWGQFFPNSFSSFLYEKSLASDYMSLSPVQVTVMGFNHANKEDSAVNNKIINQTFSNVPPTLVSQCTEKLLSENYLCEISASPFSLQSKELELYKHLNLPPPARAFEQRHRERLARLSSKRTFSYNCPSTEKAMLTAFPEKWRQPVIERASWQRIVKHNSRDDR